MKQRKLKIQDKIKLKKRFESITTEKELAILADEEFQSKMNKRW